MIYKLLIVDDEPEIVSCLLEMLRRDNEMELDLFKAYSAKDALEIMETTRIDVLLSDIKMPGTNGLQLLEKVRQKWPDCRVIFLTGYKEFDYAYTVMQHKGVRYLLKTEDDQKILDAVREAVNEIEASLIDRNILDVARQQMKYAVHLVQKEYLSTLIDGSGVSGAITQESLDDLEVPLDAGSPVMMIVCRFDRAPVDMSVRQRLQYMYSLKSLGELYLPKKYNFICFTASLADLVWIYQYETVANTDVYSPTDDVQLRSALELLQASCRKTLSVSVSIAMSSKQIHYSALAYEYHKLKQLLVSKLGIDNEIILSDKSLLIEPKQSMRYDDSYNTINRLKAVGVSLESCQQGELLKNLALLLDSIGTKSKSDPLAMEVYLCVAMLFLRYINRWGLASKIEPVASLHKLTRVNDFESWFEASKYLSNLAIRMLEARNDDEKRKDISITTRVQQYIIEHPGEDLSLTKLADLVFLNPSYLSRLFKECARTNISDFISETRLLKAKELLSVTQKRINEISLEIGYDSPHSFARFFRHYTGMSPVEFRESINKNKEKYHI